MNLSRRDADLAARQAGLSPTRLSRIGDHLARAYVDAGKIAGCQVAVSRRGHLAYVASLGHADRERAVPMAEDTIFRIYSMTKPIVSIALMALYERALFQLNDPLTRFYPAFKDHRVYVSGAGEAMVTEPPRRPISVKDILTHMAGLTYGGALPNQPADHPVDQAYRALKIRSVGSSDTSADFIAKLAKVPLRYHPGEKWQYSLATDMCGALVETLTGQSLDRVLAREIFEPLGMVDTAFHVPPEKIQRFAANYQRQADKSLKVIDDPQASPYGKPPSFCSGGGGLVGTLFDYVRFADMLRRGGVSASGDRIIGARTLDLMRQNFLPGGTDLASCAIDAFSETPYRGVGFGLGFAMSLDRTTTGQAALQDYYWGGAASTLFWVDPDEDLTVVFMTQLMPSTTFDFRAQLKALVYAAIED